MRKNVANQFVDVVLLLKASGDNATGLTPTVRIKQDGGTWGAGAGTVKEGEDGSYEYEPTQAETDCDHLVVKWTEATVLTVLQNIYPIDVALYQADLTDVMKTSHINATGGNVNRVTLTDTTTTNTDMRGTDNASTHTAAQAGTDAASKVLATPANLLATTASGEVTTDTPSRIASQADVTNLDVQVSSRMPTTHIAATGGKVNSVGSVDVTTDVTNPVTTDTASRDASKADLTTLEADVADIPKRDDGDTYRQLRDGAGVIVQQIRETLTTTEQP